MPQDAVLMQLSDICRHLREHTASKDELDMRVYKQVKRLLIIATDYGFDKNLWHNYLTFLLITDENPFSITCEKVGAGDGSVNHFARNDFQAFRELFAYDFACIPVTAAISYEMLSSPGIFLKTGIINVFGLASSPAFL